MNLGSFYNAHSYQSVLRKSFGNSYARIGLIIQMLVFIVFAWAYFNIMLTIIQKFIEDLGFGEIWEQNNRAYIAIVIGLVVYPLSLLQDQRALKATFVLT